jgi:hypothetical protein
VLQVLQVQGLSIRMPAILPGCAVPVCKGADTTVSQPAPVTHKIRLKQCENQIKG